MPRLWRLSSSRQIRAPDQRLVFRTNVEDVVIASPDHPIKVVEKNNTSEPAPVTIREAGRANQSSGFLRAGRNRQPIPGDESVLGVVSSGEMFPLGRTDV